MYVVWGHTPVAKFHNGADDEVAVGRMKKHVEVLNHRVMFKPLPAFTHVHIFTDTSTMICGITRRPG